MAAASSRRSDAPAPLETPDEDLNPLYRRVFERSRKAARQVLDRRFRLLRLAHDAYRKTLEEDDALAQVKDDLLALIRLVRAWAQREYRQIPVKTLLSVVGTVIYFLSPIDAIPDFVPVVGYLDDIAVISAVVRSVRSDLDRFRTWEENECLETGKREKKWKGQKLLANGSP